MYSLGGVLGIRGKKMFISWVYIVGTTILLSIIAAILRSGSASAFFVFLIIINVIASYWISSALQKYLIVVAQCPHCGTMLDLYGKWKCTCGYISPRHAFETCKNCKSSFEFIPCPKCEVAIGIWERNRRGGEKLVKTEHLPLIKEEESYTPKRRFEIKPVSQYKEWKLESEMARGIGGHNQLENI